jgi:hypothetical protein
LTAHQKKDLLVGQFAFTAFMLTNREQQILQRLCEELREGDLRSFAAAIAALGSADASAG